MSRNKVLVLLGGGIDSAVVLYQLKREGWDVEAISIYDDRSSQRDMSAARDIANAAGVSHRFVELPDLVEAVAIPGSANVPEPRALTLENRNMIRISIAGAAAFASRANALAVGIHAGDRGLAPDFRPSFLDAMNRALSLASWQSVALLAPLLRLDKAAIVRKGVELSVPFDRTFSCDGSESLHCGTCNGCQERKAAFAAAGVPDPGKYQLESSEAAAEQFQAEQRSEAGSGLPGIGEPYRMVRPEDQAAPQPVERVAGCDESPSVVAEREGRPTTYNELEASGDFKTVLRPIDPSLDEKGKAERPDDPEPLPNPMQRTSGGALPGTPGADDRGRGWQAPPPNPPKPAIPPVG